MTTILLVRRPGDWVFIGGDGQVSLDKSILKSNAKKVRRLYENRVITGFAGGTADALNLFERFEAKLRDYHGHLTRAAVELAKDWRTDKILRRLEALLLVADTTASLMITGNGDVLEPPDDGNILAIGSGGFYAQAAARALFDNTKLDAKSIVTKSLKIAADICVYTNQEITLEGLKLEAKEK